MIDWIIFVLTEFLPIIVLTFHLLSKLFLPLQQPGIHRETIYHQQHRTVLDNNMKEESTVARKHIIDHVRNKS